MENLIVRPLIEDDFDTLPEIDEESLGKNRWDYWEKKRDQFITQPSPISFVAEMEGQIVGLILGDVSSWEFGIPDTMGWIETILVKPAYRKKGVAKALVHALIERMKTKGVKTVYTLVTWDDWDLLQFFHSIGFTKGEMIHLELRI